MTSFTLHTAGPSQAGRMASASFNALRGLRGFCSAAKERGRFTLAVHGGAGVIKETVASMGEQPYRQKLNEALEAGHSILSVGGTSLDAVEAAVKVLEDSELFNAGRGSVFAADGTHEMEASVVQGHTRRAGAVYGLRTTRHPVSAARVVMERSPHVMLGPASEHWLGAAGLEQQDASWFGTDVRRRQLEQAKRREAAGGAATSLDHESLENEGARKGTVGAVALDMHGDLAAATSTGGMTNKWAGRVGDSPIIGAGTHACTACAVSCTGRGEQFLRHSVAAAVGTLVASGVPLPTACERLVHHTLFPGDGGLVAIDSRGTLSMPFSTTGMFRGWASHTQRPIVAIWNDEDDRTQRGQKQRSSTEWQLQQPVAAALAIGVACGLAMGLQLAHLRAG
jgi:beta-aspartyl-peptidase (threonine type)